jgi:hypothetical protein
MKQLLYCLTALLLFSCQGSNNQDNQKKDKTNDEWLKFSTEMVDYWEGRKMALPDTLKLINPNSSFQNNIPKLKMVSYIDGSCSMCVENLSQWIKFIDTINHEGEKCKFVFYIHTEDEEKFQRDVLNKLGFNAPWLSDRNNDFIRANKLYDLRFQTALLDESDRVLLIGTMSLRPPLQELYKQTIKRLSN